MRFVHLHNHSEFSPLDGLSLTEQMIEMAARDKQEAIAITDHGNLAGVPEFYFNAKKSNVSPILGQEFYITEDARDKESPNRHLLLMARNLRGWHFLVELTSIANEQQYFMRNPRIDLYMLKRQFKKELINVTATSTCLSSEIARALQDNGKEAAEAMLRKYLSIFPNFYLEFQRHPVLKKYKNSKKMTPRVKNEQEFANLEARYNAFLMDMRDKYQVPSIITGDTHFAEEEDHEIHEFLLAMQTGTDWDNPERWSFNGSRYHIASTKEMRKLWTPYPELWQESLRNINDIAMESTGFKVPEFETSTWHIPKIPGQKGDPIKVLRAKCIKGLKAKGLWRKPRYRKRLEHELSVIREANFEQIFLIVEDYVNYARRRGILVGPGRGSMVGTLTSYSLGITLIDPIKYRLLFERAINPARPSIPDFDIDFDSERIEEVIEYVRQKYGPENVMLIGSHLHMAPKATIKAVLRTLKVPFQTANEITGAAPDVAEITNHKAENDMAAILDAIEVPALDEVFENYPIARKAMLKLNGSLKSFSKHAAGVIISDAGRPLVKEVPVMRIASSNTYASQYDMEGVKKLHLVKFDFLAITTLMMIAQAIEMIGHDPFEGKDDYEDEETFKMMSRGDLVTTFQYQGGAAKRCILDMGVSNFEDIVAVNAIARPGAIRFLPNYIEGKKNPKRVRYACEEVKPILEYTYGVILYQEQVMEMVKELAGWDDLGADRIKEAIKSKSGGEFDEMKDDFIKGCMKNEISRKAAESMWAAIDDYRSYGFNRAHSVAYAAVGFQTAYLKCHYPKEWFTAVLNNTEKNFTEIIDELRRINVKLILPDINKSGPNFELTKKGIRFGLTQIKGMGPAAVRDLIEIRKKGGPFTSMDDFIDRIQSSRSLKNKARVEALKRSGALRRIGGGEYGSRYQMETLGTHVTNYPLDPFRVSLRKLLESRDNQRALNGTRKEDCYWGGIVSRVKEIKTKRGDDMAFVDVSFYGQSYGITLFPDQYARYRSLATPDSIVVVRGEFDPERRSIVCENMRKLTSAKN